MLLAKEEKDYFQDVVQKNIDYLSKIQRQEQAKRNEIQQNLTNFHEAINKRNAELSSKLKKERIEHQKKHEEKSMRLKDLQRTKDIQGLEKFVNDLRNEI